MSIVFVSQNRSETAQILAASLDSSRVAGLPYGFTGLIVNYGRWEDYYVPMGCKVLNNTEAVRLSSDKYSSLIRLKSDGISVPEVYRSFPNRPCIARTTNHHSGSGFWLCMNKSDADKAISEGASYFVDYIPVKAEYRIHCFQGRVLDVRKKIMNENSDKELDRYVRSIHKGWKMVEANYSNTIPQEVLDDCTRALYSLGLDFGAVDLLKSDDNKFYIIEVNSSPGLSMENTVKKYCNAIQEVHDKYFKKEEPEVTREELLNAIRRIERRTVKYNKPYVLTGELLRELRI